MTTLKYTLPISSYDKQSEAPVVRNELLTEQMKPYGEL